MIRGLVVTLVILLVVAGAAVAWMSGVVDGWVPRATDASVPPSVELDTDITADACARK